MLQKSVRLSRTENRSEDVKKDHLTLDAFFLYTPGVVYNICVNICVFFLISLHISTENQLTQKRKQFCPYDNDFKKSF